MGKLNKRRKEELQERKANIQPIPKEFYTWVEKELYKRVSHIYYKRNGKRADFHCVSCGADYQKLIRRSDSLLGQLEEVIPVPKHNMPCRCAVCGAEGVYKASGKIKDDIIYGVREKCYIGQKYKDGVVIRYFEIEKTFGKKQKVEYRMEEIARNFFLPGKKIIKDYRLQDFSGKIDWHDHNVGGLQNICQKEGSVYPGSYESLKGTFLEYTGLQEYEKRAGKVKAAKYLELYMRCPHLEMLEKTGMYDTIDYLMQSFDVGEIIKDETARRPADILAVWPDRISMLRKVKGCIKMLKIFQLERHKGIHWPDDVCYAVCGLRLDLLLLETAALEYMTVRKFLNRVQKYAGAEYTEEMCWQGKGVLRSTAMKYLDYLQMRQARGYDLHNTIFAYPENLERAHGQMVEEVNTEQREKRVQEVEEKFPVIKKRYEKLYQYYYYAAEGLLIRPAKSAAEIVREGQILHHCVGGNRYLGNHNQGRSVILLLRHANIPEKPYITVEIKRTEIVQWYGAYDKKPDQQKIESWLKNYIWHLRQADRTDKEITIRAAG